MSKRRIEREIEIVRRALGPIEPKIKPNYYRLDYDTMTEQEKFIVKGAMEAQDEVWERAKKEQNVNSIAHLNMNKIQLTTDEVTLFKAFDILFQRHAISPNEYSARHPIH